MCSWDRGGDSKQQQQQQHSMRGLQFHTEAVARLFQCEMLYNHNVFHLQVPHTNTLVAFERCREGRKRIVSKPPKSVLLRTTKDFVKGHMKQTSCPHM